MSAISQSYIIKRFKPWQIILVCGILLCILYGIGSFTLDYFAGGATQRFLIWPEVEGVGFFFLYVLSFYMGLLVVLPILAIQRFGVGLAVYLPYAIAGLFTEYYIEWVSLHTLKSPWGVVGWCVIGLLIGLSADFAYRFLPGRLSERWRAILTGVVTGMVNFILINLALTFFYVAQQSGPGSFLGIAYYGLPMLILNYGFGGYTAYAISRNV